jgi:hypothetical protein
MPRVLALVGGTLVALAAASTAPPSKHVDLTKVPYGDTPESPVYRLLERLLPNTSPAFNFTIAPCPGGNTTTITAKPDDSPRCFSVSDAPPSDGRDGPVIQITASGPNELAAGLGVYLREVCNMTIGWERGGGTNVFVPAQWPAVGATPISRARNTPFSYMMNVCTHSYSLVWYDWAHWQVLIDWMALSGLNLVLAMTGQEEVQYKVFTQLGLNDTTIRTWFNGPAFLTWSRGQNE